MELTVCVWGVSWSGDANEELYCFTNEFHLSLGIELIQYSYILSHLNRKSQFLLNSCAVLCRTDEYD